MPAEKKVDRASSERASLTNAFAIQLLRDFIPAQFPTSDPRKQVEAAFLYAKLMAEVAERDKPSE